MSVIRVNRRGSRRNFPENPRLGLVFSFGLFLNYKRIRLLSASADKRFPGAPSRHLNAPSRSAAYTSSCPRRAQADRTARSQIDGNVSEAVDRAAPDYFARLPR